MSDETNFALVADIGGTNARFGRVNLQSLHIDCVSVYACSNFADIRDAVQFYLKDHCLTGTIRKGTIAIACPVHGDEISMTNLHWRFSIRKLEKDLGFEFLAVINDFLAQAYSLQAIAKDKILPIGSHPTHSMRDKIKLVIGAGTGLGVACLLPLKNGFEALASESGHMQWSAHSDQDRYIYDYLHKQFGRVSVERVLSGAGLESIHSALAAFYSKPVSPLSAAQIVQQALAGHSSLAKAAVAQFILIMARFAGDLALAFNALGGVYLAGGIMPKLLSLSDPVEFRYHFEDKGRFREFNKQIPAYIVTEEHPGLAGAGVYCRQTMRQEVILA